MGGAFGSPRVMSADAITAVENLWRESRGAATLASWASDDAGVTQDHARALVNDVVRATSGAIPWGPIEKPAYDGPEGMSLVFHRAIAARDAVPGLIFRVAARLDEDDDFRVLVRAEWTKPPTGRLDAHDDVARSLADAAARLLALVDGERFAQTDRAALRALKGVELHEIDPEEAFERRCKAARGRDSTTGRLESALGAINGLVFRRLDSRAWNDPIDHAVSAAANRAWDHMGDSAWNEELELDLRLVLIANAFPSSTFEEAEEMRPLVQRIEAILAAGGLVFDARGKNLSTAELRVCPAVPASKRSQKKKRSNVARTEKTRPKAKTTKPKAEKK